MMMQAKSFYETVQRLILATGKDYNVKTVVEGPYDPATGSTSKTETTYVFKASKFNYTLRSSGESINAESLVQANDKKIFLLPRQDGITPQPGNWFVEIDNIWWTVLTIRTVNPSENYAMLHEVQCRLS